MEDVIAILALYRPDTMRELEHFIKRKNGQESITYIHTDLEPILNKTYGSMIYQEQLMEISKVFAGYSDGEADDLRKGLGKKDKGLVREQGEKFKVKAMEKAYPETVCNELAEILCSMGNYLFNKGHASGYGITTYKTAYLKANFPVEFMTALISNQRKATGATDYESVGLYVMKCREMGIEIKNPDINLSQRDFISQGNSILFGFNLIKGIGENATDEILSKRPFDNFQDFLSKVTESGSVSKTAVIALIKAGAFDFTGVGRKELLEEYGSYRFNHGMDDIKPINKINKTHIVNLIEIKAIRPHEETDKEFCLTVLNRLRQAKHLNQWQSEIMQGDKYCWEFETLSYYLSGDPFSDYKLPLWDTYSEDFEMAKFFGTPLTVKKTKIKKGKQKGRTMAFIEFSTPEGLREGICFSDVWERFNSKLEKGNALVVRGRKQGNKCIINGIMLLENWIKCDNQVKAVH